MRADLPDIADAPFQGQHGASGKGGQGEIDELHFAMSPVLLGRGESMFKGLDLPNLGYRVMESTASDAATHVVLARGVSVARPS